jgi:poly-beta-1,6-N-acetyl-D-glucosamine synthase
MRLLIVTPVRDEAGHLDLVIDAMAAQTRRPDLWVVVEDGSVDGSRELLERRARELDFMRVVVAPSARHSTARDRLAAGAAPRTFNIGLRAAGAGGWDFVGKLDGDIQLPSDYFERLLAEFARDPELGIVGGQVVERRRGRWTPVGVPPHHVPGAVKLYRRACLERIGGVVDVLGWDTIDEMYARMHGFRTRSYRDLVVRHHRPTGTADGLLRGRARLGACAYVAGYPRYFVLARSLKLATAPPAVISGAAFLWGYVRAAANRAPRIEDEAFRAHVREELRGRVLARLPVALRRAYSS